MTTFLPLLPLMILTGAILVLMMAIAFMRNLALSCGISVQEDNMATNPRNRVRLIIIRLKPSSAKIKPIPNLGIHEY